ncbi:DUF6703 family protein [Pedococcus sp. 5OH_020]|uniref:DUF6703 family protein n=1 Tax=Pedococcus sp. 5OH_020 TaxID=2989814 RepID=UPI0022E9A0E4|nr:DUF6703 family protein [Pedococcus sp. 5OH_020]
MSTRQRIERVSTPALRWLDSLPRVVPFGLVLALMVAGLFVPGWGWLLLLVVVLFLVWTLYLSWPVLEATPRLARVAVILLAMAITVTQAFPRH